jgi:hypothetical protein
LVNTTVLERFSEVWLSAHLRADPRLGQATQHSRHGALECLLDQQVALRDDPDDLVVVIDDGNALTR